MGKRPKPQESLPREILEFYNEGKELGRLSQGLGRLELVRIQELIGRYFPPSPAVVFDIGGGPGVHSLWLAKSGYEVHLIDAVPLHVEQARKVAQEHPAHPIASLKVGDARNLDYPDSSADAILLHGPLYHLTDRNDRLQTIRESKRILRPGGILLAVAITSYSSTIVGLIHGWIWDTDYFEMIREVLKTGQHRKPADWNVFTTAFFHHPDDLKSELEDAGMIHERTLGIEGPGWMVPDLEENWRRKRQREAILEIARMMEQEPVMSPHIVAMARKPR